jgi:hypothetical protein
MKTLTRLLIAAVLVAGCGQNPVEPDSHIKTIPVAEGNTWVYRHTKEITLWSWHAPDSIESHEYRQGQCKLVVVSATASAVTLTVSDSGASTLNDTGFSSFCDLDRLTFSIPLKEDLFITQYGYSAPSMPYSSPAAPLPYFLTYAPFPDTTINHLYLTQAYQLSSYNRQTDQGNGTDGLHTTTTGFLIYDGMYDEIHSDTLKWLDDVGVFHDSHTKVISTYGHSPLSRTVETYSLLSFNGSPVTVSP